MFNTILKTIKQEKTKSNLSEQPDIEQIPKKEVINYPFQKTIFQYDKYQIADKLIQEIYYIPNILQENEQEYLMNEIYENSKQWNDLPHSQRRVQKYGGDVTQKGLDNQYQLPLFLKKLSNYTFLDINLPINHALINEYTSGIGIHPHFDGPLYHNFVNIFSLNGKCVFKFTKQNDIIKLLIEPLSLLIFTKQAYTEWLHGIDYYQDDTILVKIIDQKIQMQQIGNIQLLKIQHLKSFNNNMSFVY